MTNICHSFDISLLNSFDDDSSSRGFFKYFLYTLIILAAILLPTGSPVASAVF